MTNIIDYDSRDMRAIFQRIHDAMSTSQREAVGVFRQSQAMLLAAWMGLGKTLVSLTCMLTLKPTRVLIICNKNAVATWENEFRKWYPELYSPEQFKFVDGDAYDRQSLWRTRAQFHICLPQIIQRDYEFLVQNKLDYFDFIIIDEAHKLGLRNRKTKTFQIVKWIREHAKGIIINTGTPTRKGPPQLWGYLHILARRKFTSYWTFINKYCIIHKGIFGQEVIGVQNTEQLKEEIKPYIYVVDEKKASLELPPLRRILLPAEFDVQTAKLYRSMADSLYMELDDRIEFSLSVMASYIKLRQLICCPQIIDPFLSVGCAISSICEKIQENEDYEGYKHNIIATPFIPSIEPFKKYMASTLKMAPSDIMVLKGGDDPTHVNKVEEIFRKNKETAVICSVMFSQSFNLETALSVYFAHFDWDVDNNKQTESRARRKSSDMNRTLMSYYVDVKGTITKDMFAIIDSNLAINNMTYKHFSTIKESLKNP